MTARQIQTQVRDIAACAALAVAVFLVAVALFGSLDDGWLTFPVGLSASAVAAGAGLARARWYRRGGAS